MEIVSNQTGQAFATVPVTNEVPAETTLPIPAPNRVGPSEQGDVDNERSQTRPASENTTQGIEENADTAVREVERQALSTAVSEVESFLQGQNRNLTFSIDEDTSRAVVTVKDSESGDLIRQIPSEEVLKLAERIQELQQDVGSSIGVFINNEV